MRIYKLEACFTFLNHFNINLIEENNLLKKKCLNYIFMYRPTPSAQIDDGSATEGIF